VALGWEPRVGAGEGLPKIIEWFAGQLATRQEVSSPQEEDSQCPVEQRGMGQSHAARTFSR
jgi:hypothetical protein